MTDHIAEMTVRQIIERHLADHPNEFHTYNNDPEFRRRVDEMKVVLVSVCDSAQRVGAPYHDAIRMLEMAVESLVKTPPGTLLAQQSAGNLVNWAAMQPKMAPPVIPLPGRISLATLYQGEAWTTVDGIVMRIEDMQPSHCRNVVRMLHRQAGELAFLAGTAMLASGGPMGEVASDRFDRELEDLQDNPARWLDDTELIKALRRRAGWEN